MNPKIETYDAVRQYLPGLRASLHLSTVYQQLYEQNRSLEYFAVMTNSKSQFFRLLDNANEALENVNTKYAACKRDAIKKMQKIRYRDWSLENLDTALQNFREFEREFYSVPQQNNITLSDRKIA